MGGCLKVAGVIILVILLIYGCVAITEGCKSSSNNNKTVNTPIVHTDNREALLGVWRGTYSGNDGFGGKEILMFKNAEYYRAQISIYPVQGSPRGFPTGRWIADDAYDPQTGQVVMSQIQVIADSAGRGFANRRCLLKNNTLIGSIDGHAGSSINLNKADKSNYVLNANHDHIAGNETSVVTEATCIKLGAMAYNCIFCHREARRESIPLTSHTASGIWRISREPSCTEEGIRIQNCRICNQELLREAIPVIAHNANGNWIVIENPACTEEGIRIQNCRFCGLEAIREAVPIIDHSANGEWLVIKEPLCNESGLHIQYCTVCKGEALVEEMPAITGLDHVFEKQIIFGNKIIPPIIREDVCVICNFTGNKYYDFTFIWLTIIILIGISFGIYFLVMFIKNLLSFVCPYCFNKFYKKDVPYPEYKCPGCSETIPKIVLKTSILPFSIIGVSGSGKTNYITVMLNELERAMSLPLTLAPQNDYTKDHQNDNYSRIYERHIPPESTAAGAALKPQIWCITNTSRNKGNKVPRYTFTIYDGAGEDHENIQTSQTNVSRYIKYSEAIMIALDPLLLVNVRNKGIVNKDEMRNSMSGSEDEYKNGSQVVNDVVSCIKQAFGIQENIKLKIPVAVVLTKFDTIIKHDSFDDDALVKKSSSIIRNGKFSMEEVVQIDKEIREWLNKIEEVSFVRSIEANFKTSYFFGVSSLGEPPKSGDALSEHIKPHRVLDPILWLFKMKKFID